MQTPFALAGTHESTSASSKFSMLFSPIRMKSTSKTSISVALYSSES